jgi:hypothetical protein
MNLSLPTVWILARHQIQLNQIPPIFRTRINNALDTAHSREDTCQIHDPSTTHAASEEYDDIHLGDTQHEPKIPCI